MTPNCHIKKMQTIEPFAVLVLIAGRAEQQVGNGDHGSGPQNKTQTQSAGLT